MVGTPDIIVLSPSQREEQKAPQRGVPWKRPNTRLVQ